MLSPNVIVGDRRRTPAAPRRPRLLDWLGYLLFSAGVALALYSYLARPWLMRWGATEAEAEAALPGDILVPRPAYQYTRAVTIAAPPGQVWPWLAQMGQGRAGLYSYEWIENWLLGCEMQNADRIHPEWQAVQAGDLVRMSAEGSGPPPYQVAMVLPGQALILGHQEADGHWADVWEFVVHPAADGQTRLIVRARRDFKSLIFDILDPGIFVMERGMLLGIKERAEAMP